MTSWRSWRVTGSIDQFKGDNPCLEETEPAPPAGVVRERAGVEAGAAASAGEVEGRDGWEVHKPAPDLREAAFVPIAATAYPTI